MLLKNIFYARFTKVQYLSTRLGTSLLLENFISNQVSITMPNACNNRVIHVPYQVTSWLSTLNFYVKTHKFVYSNIALCIYTLNTDMILYDISLVSVQICNAQHGSNWTSLLIINISP